MNKIVIFVSLFQGDEVIEWNGRTLQGKSYQEVAEIIAESKHEANVELIVSRSMGSRRAAQIVWKQSMAYRGTLNDTKYTTLYRELTNFTHSRLKNKTE